MNNDQKIEKVLVFDVWGDYAHYRRFYTTTSPLTFPIPTRTALCGLIGAIIGLDNKENRYLDSFSLDYAYIGIKLDEKHPLKKVIIAQNLIDTKKSKGVGMNLIANRTQIRFELIKNPKYRIYFYHRDENIYNKLRDYLGSHLSVYTPCLGLSENIANFKYVGEFSAKEKIETGIVQISTILPKENISDNEGIVFKENKEYFSIKIPIEMNTDRVVTKYGDVIFERNGQHIETKLKESYFEVNLDGSKENIVFIQ